MGKKNESKSAKVSEETVQSEGSNKASIEDNSEALAANKKFAESNEVLMGELQDRADELNKKEADLNKWAKELAERAKKGKGKPEDITYNKKLTNCYINGTVEEYLRTSAEQFEDPAKQNFLNAVKEAADNILTNPKN